MHRLLCIFPVLELEIWGTVSVWFFMFFLQIIYWRDGGKRANNTKGKGGFTIHSPVMTSLYYMPIHWLTQQTLNMFWFKTASCWTRQRSSAPLISFPKGPNITGKECTLELFHINLFVFSLCQKLIFFVLVGFLLSVASSSQHSQQPT